MAPHERCVGAEPKEIAPNGSGEKDSKKEVSIPLPELPIGDDDDDENPVFYEPSKFEKILNMMLCRSVPSKQETCRI